MIPKPMKHYRFVGFVFVTDNKTDARPNQICADGKTKIPTSACPKRLCAI